MIYGYIRVSSQKQSVEHQEYEIKQYALKKGIKMEAAGKPPPILSTII